MGALAQARGTRAFLVGGPVRDILLGQESPDIDIAVELDARGFGQALARELGGRFVYHARFLTGTVTPGEHQSGLLDHIDVTQTRTEAYSRPAVLPTVKPAGIEQDLGRRDFTVNAMALELTPGAFGRLLDPFGGRADIADRAVRVLHERSFIDDPTRAFRAIRFAARLGFEIEPRTLALLRDCVRQGYPALLTPERILYELRLICAESKVVPIFEAVLREGLLASCFGLASILISPPSFLSALQRLSRQHARPELLYIFVLSRLPLTDRFPITREEREAAAAVRDAGRIRSRLLRAGRLSTVYRVISELPVPARELLAMLEPDPVGRMIRQCLDRLQSVRVVTTGSDFRRLGLAPGPAYRRILDKLLFARLDGVVLSDADEARLARSLVRRALVAPSPSPKSSHG